MNVHDSRAIEEILINSGYRKAESQDDADILLVNSCTIREKPWHKAISETGRFRKIKGIKDNILVGLVGCVAQQEGDNIFNLLNGIDFVVSPDNYNSLPEIIKKSYVSKTGIALVGFGDGSDDDFLGLKSIYPSESSALVTIMKGCNEHCRYCIVPSVRGPERNRSIESIEKEVRNLTEQGIKEVTLLGQKVNAYKHEGMIFSDLLIRLDKIEKLERLRFTSPHPRHMTKDVTDLYGQLRTLCGAIHLPAQSGSNNTLKSMGRRYTREEYLDIVERLRKKIPDISISTDLIVGYPGETEEDFKETLSLIKEAGFSSAFSFKFSPRPGTPAFKLDNDVSEDEKSERLSRVHEIISKQEFEFRQSLKGKNLQVLVDGKGRLDSQLSGRGENFQIVNFQHSKSLEEMFGKIVTVEITEVNSNSLLGVAVEK
ncbi:MAG: tRNA (N6-isopentenyl adenosine(37)-C2)-methylthiotransferase MiaB [Deltaproteobacteria bacterium]|nr:tRNA (N6-isopentenyl adenosine(37)-C2)-methylthiotransferase MiaB [Deltaproteobacteria bacterium]